MIMIKADIKQTDPLKVAFLTMQGAYHQIPEGYDKLYEYVTSHELEPTGPPHAVYLTPPETPEAEAVWELWAPVEDAAEETGPDERGLGVKLVPSMTVAWAMHMGPYESIEPTYLGLADWITQQGHTVVGPPEEIYFSDPDEVAPEEYLTEVRFPIAP